MLCLYWWMARINSKGLVSFFFFSEHYKSPSKGTSNLFLAYFVSSNKVLHGSCTFFSSLLVWEHVSQGLKNNQLGISDLCKLFSTILGYQKKKEENFNYSICVCICNCRSSLSLIYFWIFPNQLGCICLGSSSSPILLIGTTSPWRGDNGVCPFLYFLYILMTTKIPLLLWIRNSSSMGSFPFVIWTTELAHYALSLFLSITITFYETGEKYNTD